MRRDNLSPDEREEYDALLSEAYADDGGRLASKDVGERIHILLQNALMAGYTWAGWVLRDDACAGHLARFKRWDKDRNLIRVVTPGGQIVPRTAVVGVKRRNEDGQLVYQQALWSELTWDEVDQKLREANAQMMSARITVETAKRLSQLREVVPSSAGPAEACIWLGLNLESYLAGEATVA